jgi:hypothetical protein
MGRGADTISLLATALLLGGCGAARPEWKALDLSPEQVQSATITLHEESCAWGCWSREVTITGSGELTSLNGSKVVRTAHLSEAEVRDLLGGFYRAQLQMPCQTVMVKDKNTGDMELQQSVGDCQSYARTADFQVIGNDLPSVSVEVTIDGETFYYSGMFGPDKLNDFMARLHSLE